MEIITFLPIFFLSFLFALLLTPWIGKLAKKFDVIQYPPSVLIKKLPEAKIKVSGTGVDPRIIAARRRLEKPPMANWGGIGYIIPFLVISIATLAISKTINIPPSELNSYILWFAAIIVLLIMGIVDDKYELSGKVQIIFQMLAAILFILSPINLTGITNPFTGVPLFAQVSDFAIQLGTVYLSFSFPGDLILFIWIMVMINAIKWQGGTDALMEGNVFIASLVIFAVSIIFMQPASALFSITLAGALLGFIIYNFYPAKIMSASAGKSVIGFLVATLAVISNAKFAISLIVFALPIIDMMWVLLHRIIDYKPKSIFQLLLISDKSHFHHKLLKLGFSEVKVALFEYSITAILGFCAVILRGPEKILFVIVAWAIVFFIILFVTLKANGKR